MCLLSIYSFTLMSICSSYYKIVSTVLYTVSWLHNFPEYYVAATTCSYTIHVCPFYTALPS
jgi:hypothetical protein